MSPCLLGEEFCSIYRLIGLYDILWVLELHLVLDSLAVVTVFELRKSVVMIL
jgi:hypothetical protein